MTCARDFRVVKNVKYEQKRKEKTERVNRLNIADEILEVLGMVNDHPFVQSLMHNKDQVPNVICYTNEQLIDLKHFVRNSNNQAIGIDRTFNFGPFLPTKQIKIFCFINWKMTILCNNMLKSLKPSKGRDPAVSCGTLRYPVVSRGILWYPAVIRPTLRPSLI